MMMVKMVIERTKRCVIEIGCEFYKEKDSDFEKIVFYFLAWLLFLTKSMPIPYLSKLELREKYLSVLEREKR